MNLPENSRTVAFVYATDLERAVTFYRDTLGLTLRSRDAFGAFLEGAGALIRMTPMADFQPGQHPVVGWDVPDIASAVRALKAAGVSFTVYEGMGQDALGIWSSPDGGARIAWFADPDGNVLSLSETR